jgi:hypothetical protein
MSLSGMSLESLYAESSNETSLRATDFPERPLRSEGGYFGSLSIEHNNSNTVLPKCYVSKATGAESLSLTSSQCQTDSSVAGLTNELRTLRTQLSGVASTIGHVIDFLESHQAGDISTTEHDEPAQLIELDVMPPQPAAPLNDASIIQDLLTNAGPSGSPNKLPAGTADRQRRRNIIGSGPRDSRVVPSLSSVREGELFLFNVHRSISTYEVLDYVRERASVVGLTEISHPNSVSKSFLLTVPSSCVDHVLDSNFWPCDVQCREFVRPASGRLARK